jgi:hypothetical protein
VNAVANIMPGAASLLLARRGRPSDAPEIIVEPDDDDPVGPSS